MLAAQIKIITMIYISMQTRDMKPTHMNIPKLGENMCVIPSEA